MATLSTAQRDALVKEHFEYASALVLQLANEIGAGPGRDDMLAAGHKGLLEAAGRFDPTRGVTFKTFCYYRVRGAVIDSVRRYYSQQPWKQARRSLLLSTAAIDAAVEQQLSGRPADPKDTAARAAEALSQVLDAAVTAFTVGEAARSLMAESEECSPEELAATKELYDRIGPVIDELPERERTMLKGVYFSGLTIEEAGATMGLSKSWASRLHARALGLMRERMNEAA